MKSQVFQQHSSTTIASRVELAVVVPTFNERENVNHLLERLDVALKGLRWEVIFVDDDSPDGTAHLTREIAQHRAEVRHHTPNWPTWFSKRVC